MKRPNASQLALSSSTSTSSGSETAHSTAPFPYRDYVAARAKLEAAIRKGLFYGRITGPSGTGKTSLMRELLRGLDRHRHHLVYLGASSASLLGVVRYFAETFHVMPKRSSLETSLVVTKAIREQPAHVVVWIDEAHRLPAQTLAELYTLAEFDSDVPQVFSVIFSGPPELCHVLDDRRLFALKRRITISCALAGLGRDELAPFLLHRFGSQQAARIPSMIHDELFERTQGAPALLVSLVCSALERAGSAELTEDIVREVLDAQGI